ncbi:transmembrane protein 45A-like [Meriones unguiculatus]|uniref:transmembrane protein 45A-like n=1 Tax=Meriones unguiculatus TaxID=10047 RepID=UPI00293F0C28|nr:transmembrane protein 45A-like [Meriones unguiculatus]
MALCGVGESTGNFLGHALAGSFLIILGLWWNSTDILRYVCKKEKQTYHHFKAWIHRAELLGGIIVIVLVSVGITGLQLYAGHSETQLSRLLRLQHIVMYVFYGLLGVVRILNSIIHSFSVSLTTLALSNAFFLQSFVLYNHDRVGAIVEVYLHKILGLITISSGLVSFSEVITNNNLTLGLLRSSLTLLQGTWFWQIGCVLYYPREHLEWDLMDHHNNTLLSIYFCWHCLLTHIIIGVNYAAISWLVKWRLRKICFTKVPLLKQTEQDSDEM